MKPETLLSWTALQLGCKKVRMTDRFYDDLGAESVDMLHLVVLVEENTGVFIPEEQIPELKTVQEFYDYILNACKNANT